MLKHIEEKDFEREINKKGICIVDFYATWCGPCMMLAPILEEVANSRAGYNIIKIDVDKSPNIVNKLDIDTIPTICIYKDGKIIDKKIGYIQKDELIDFIEKNNK